MAKLKSYLAPNLKLLRKMRGLTQQKMGDELKISRNRIAAYESGLTEPNHQNFIKLSRYFSVDPLALITKSIEKDLSDNFSDTNTGKDKEVINNFITATREVSKIVEGYRTFYEMREEVIFQNSENKILVGQLYNLLELLEKMVSNNFKLIQKLYPTDEEE